ncbi:MAG: hypothetical protein ACFFDN_19880, partial [Candidatus Hodarchaeota archaeon]
LNQKVLTLIQFKEAVQDDIYRREMDTLIVEFTVLIQRLKTFVGKEIGGKDVKQLTSFKGEADN